MQLRVAQGLPLRYFVNRGQAPVWHGVVVRKGLEGKVKSAKDLKGLRIATSAAGGLSVTIGDGRLTYSGEKSFETYYSIWLGGGHHNALMFDYQYITNPAYNSDRGPVSLYSTRLHLEF